MSDSHADREDFEVSKTEAGWWDRHGLRIRVEINEHVPYSLQPVRLNIGVPAAKKLIEKLKAIVEELEK